MAALRLTLAVVVLMLAVVSLSDAMRGAGPKKCCFKFNEKPVAQEKVESYTRTSQRCPKSAVILKTVAGAQLCVRSTAPWVKELINTLDARPLPGADTNL